MPKDLTEKEIRRQLRRINERLEAIEGGGHGDGHDGDYEGDPPNDAPKQCCALPMVPTRELESGIDPGRESLIRSIEKKWVNGTTLRYYFYGGGAWGGSADQQQVVQDAFEEWAALGIGITFQKTESKDESDIRIGFKRGDGAWSYVGRDVWGISKSKRTMNFGWHLAGQDGRDTALHEIGHTLGFHHEQQNPFAGIVWDEDAVYAAFGGPPNNWPRNQIFNNVLRKLDPNSVEGSEWDPHSVMQYQIGPGLIIEPARFRNGLFPNGGLSEIDKERIRVFYPEIQDDLEDLRPFDAKRLVLEPAQQANFEINPTQTRRYRIQTFGFSDTVMVLFEDNDGNLEHFAADDDSGWSRNASLNVRLVRNRRYVLRVRLYFSADSGESAVMMW